MQAAKCGVDGELRIASTLLPALYCPAYAAVCTEYVRNSGTTSIFGQSHQLAIGSLADPMLASSNTTSGCPDEPLAGSHQGSSQN